MYSRAQTVGAVRISFKKRCSSWMRWANLGSAKAPRLRGTLFMSNMVVAHKIARQNGVSNTVLQLKHAPRKTAAMGEPRLRGTSTTCNQQAKICTCCSAKCKPVGLVLLHHLPCDLMPCTCRVREIWLSCSHGRAWRHDHEPGVELQGSASWHGV
jgi:hypothetical protein